MKRSMKITLGLLCALGIAVVFRLVVGNSLVALLHPQGPIAAGERDIMVKIVGLMLIIAVPMLILMYTFAWKYREGNPKAKYDPDRPTSTKSQLILWAIPAALVVVMWSVIWGSAQTLDPFNSIRSSVPPTEIQVVALPWKWLFIYPKQGIATVNEIEFPANVPVHFDLSADGPMSSFWIPQLGSQIYAMSGMMTQLNLLAPQPGEYVGKDTEINGEGYAGMSFTAKSVSQQEFDAWVQKAKQSSDTLDSHRYATLAEPTSYDPPSFFASVQPNLFDTIMMKYMKPATTETIQAPPDMPAPAKTSMPSM